VHVKIIFHKAAHRISVEKSGPSREELAARATAAMPTQAVISKSMMTSVQGLVGETKTVLSAGELQRMKEITMKEEERVARAKAELEATKGAAQRKADARKQKMLELEAQRKLAVPPVRAAHAQAKCGTPLIV
jgi:hypothetical protein